MAQFIQQSSCGWKWVETGCMYSDTSTWMFFCFVCSIGLLWAAFWSCTSFQVNARHQSETGFVLSAEQCACNRSQTSVQPGWSKGCYKLHLCHVDVCVCVYISTIKHYNYLLIIDLMRYFWKHSQPLVWFCCLHLIGETGLWVGGWWGDHIWSLALCDENWVFTNFPR